MALSSRQIGSGAALLALLVVAGALILLPTERQSVERASVSLGQVVTQLPDDEPLRRIYASRSNAPLWWDGAGITADGRATLELVAHATDHGLPAQRYNLPALPPGDAGDQAWTRFEFALTRAALAYARDMRDGMMRPKDLFDDVSLKPDQGDIVAGFSEAAARGRVAAFLQSLEPQAGEYAWLKSVLAQYRAQRPWPQVRAEKQLSQANAAALSQRLAGEGYGATDVTAALRAWKVQNGLDDNSALDAATVEALNVPAAQRAEQIAVNMERWRWLPQKLESDRIMVNVAAAALQLIEGDALALESRVVVGKPDNATPLLAARAVAVTLNPSWHVPQSIVKNEIRPKLEQDPSYLEQKNMVMEDGEVTQGPGPTNALGLMKFEMPNEFDVYLHDTPSKHAFFSDDRALSHGCVRVQQIASLVSRVSGMELSELDAAIATGQTQRKTLKTPLPVYIQYWTVLSVDGGKAGFRPDVYDRDQKMMSRLRQLRLARN